jgi:hypothetical protein
MNPFHTRFPWFVTQANELGIAADRRLSAELTATKFGCAVTHRFASEGSKRVSQRAPARPAEDSVANRIKSRRGLGKLSSAEGRRFWNSPVTDYVVALNQAVCADFVDQDRCNLLTHPRNSLRITPIKRVAGYRNGTRSDGTSPSRTPPSHSHGGLGWDGESMLSHRIVTFHPNQTCGPDFQQRYHPTNAIPPSSQQRSDLPACCRFSVTNPAPSDSVASVGRNS